MHKWELIKPSNCVHTRPIHCNMDSVSSFLSRRNFRCACLWKPLQLRRVVIFLRFPSGVKRNDEKFGGNFVLKVWWSWLPYKFFWANFVEWTSLPYKCVRNTAWHHNSKQRLDLNRRGQHFAQEIFCVSNRRLFSHFCINCFFFFFFFVFVFFFFFVAIPCSRERAQRSFSSHPIQRQNQNPSWSWDRHPQNRPLQHKYKTAQSFCSLSWEES